MELSIDDLIYLYGKKCLEFESCLRVIQKFQKEKQETQKDKKEVK